MKNTKVDAARVWKQLVDDVVPQLQMSVIDRAVYGYLLRHSRLEGKPQIRFSLAWLAHGTRLCVGTTQPALRRLMDKGALRLIECSKDGHVMQVRLPEKIRGMDVGKAARPARVVREVSVEAMNFMQRVDLRRAIHRREGGRCFYIAYAGCRAEEGAWTTLCLARGWGEILTGILCLLVMIATRKRRSVRLKSFCVGCFARGG